MKSTIETRDLAQRILDYWEATGMHEQDTWFGYGEVGVHVENINGQDINVCDTTMCAAGTAIFLNDHREFLAAAKDILELPPGTESALLAQEFFSVRGRELLGLDDNEAIFLFYTNNENAVELMRTVAQGDTEKFDQIASDYGDEYL